METEAEVNHFRARLEGMVQLFDQGITSRSNNPQAAAFYIFYNGSDIQVRQLAAVWLSRHQDEIVSPDVNRVFEDTIESVMKSVAPGREGRQ